MSSEVYSYIYEKFINDGALDIYTQSIYMKKIDLQLNYVFYVRKMI